MFTWDAVKALSAIASEERFAVLGTLVKAGGEGMSISRLSLRAGCGRRQARQHAQALADAGLAEKLELRSGVVWRADAEQVENLLAFVMRRLKPRHGRKTPKRNAKVTAIPSLGERLAVMAGSDPLAPGVVVPVRTAKAKTPRKRRMPVKLSDAIASANAA